MIPPINASHVPGPGPSRVIATRRWGHGNRGFFRIFLGLLILAAIAGGTYAYWYYYMRGIVYSDDARLAGHLVDLAPEISGRLTDVLVQEGETVRQGQVIFRLDPAAYRATLNQNEALMQLARANQAVSQAKLNRSVNGNRPEEILGAEAQLKKLQGEEDLARVEFARVQRLIAQHLVAQDDLDHARTTFESARASRENEEQVLALLRRGSRVEDIDAAKADLEVSKSQVAAASATFDKAREDLSRCVVSAPFDGLVVRRWLQPGAMPLPGQPVVSLFDPTTLRVDANIEERYLSLVNIGDQATIEVDAYPDLVLHGHVTDILRATNSQFSLIPAEGVSGTFIKVTQRLPLRIALDRPPDLPLAPGLSVEVRVHIATPTTEVKPLPPLHD